MFLCNTEASSINDMSFHHTAQRLMYSASIVLKETCNYNLKTDRIGWITKNNLLDLNLVVVRSNLAYAFN